MKTLGHAACIFGLSVLLQACGLVGDSSPARSFQATTSGSMARQLSGEAVFDSDYRTGIMPHLGLLLTSDDGSVIFEGPSITSTPKPGHYHLGSFAAPKGILAFFTPCGSPDCGSARAYLSTGGTLTFSQTNKDHLQGSFNFSATNGADSLHVQGTFDAEGENYDASLR